MEHLQEIFGLHGKTALITGAGGGFGEAIARLFALAGAMVLLVDQDREALDRVHKDLEGLHGDEMVRSAVVDVTDFTGVARASKQLLAGGSGLHVLVNNAGISPPPRKVHEMDMLDWSRVIDVNLTSVFVMARQFIPALLAAGGGSVVNIASIVGPRGLHPDLLSQPAYAASKAGMIGLTKQIAADYGAQGVRCNAIAPGWHLDTRLGRGAGNFSDGASRELLASTIRGRTPLGRSGTSAELARLALYLASDAASFVTGTVMMHDGGWTAI